MTSPRGNSWAPTNAASSALSGSAGIVRVFFALAVLAAALGFAVVTLALGSRFLLAAIFPCRAWVFFIGGTRMVGILGHQRFVEIVHDDVAFREMSSKDRRFCRSAICAPPCGPDNRRRASGKSSWAMTASPFLGILMMPLQSG